MLLYCDPNAAYISAINIFIAKLLRQTNCWPVSKYLIQSEACSTACTGSPHGVHNVLLKNGKSIYIIGSLCMNYLMIYTTGK
jgi:hypothetical protein